jgi:hypothetical protein
MRVPGKLAKLGDRARYTASNIGGGGNAALPPYYIVGCEIEVHTPTNLYVGPGSYRSIDDTKNGEISGMTKFPSLSWVSGDSQGGLAASETLTADRTYHIYAIDDDVFLTTTWPSVVSAVLPKSASAVRRLGSLLTYPSAADIRPVWQHGDNFSYLLPGYSLFSPDDRATDIPVPVGIPKVARLSVAENLPGAATYISQWLISPATDSPTAPYGITGVTGNWYRFTGHQFAGAVGGAPFNMPAPAHVLISLKDDDMIYIHTEDTATNVGVTRMAYSVEGWVDERTK